MEIHFFIQKINTKKISKNTKESKYVIAWWPFRWFFLSSHNQPASPPKIYSPISPTAVMLTFYWTKDSALRFMAYNSQIVSFLFFNQKYMWSQRYFCWMKYKWLMFRCNFKSRTRESSERMHFVDGALNHRQYAYSILFIFQEL